MSRLLLVLVVGYLGIGIAFTGLYVALPADTVLDSNGGPVKGDNRASRWEHLAHFSFTTQSTLGYGDYSPKSSARVVAAAQAFAGVVLNSVFIAIIVFRALRPRAHVAFPSICCFDPQKNTFVFRFLNESSDSLVDPNVVVTLARYLSREEDQLISRRAYGISLDTEIEDALIPSGLLVAFRSTAASKANGTLSPTGNVLVPTDLREDDSLFVSVTGVLGATGNQVVEVVDYSVREIRCGLYQSAEKGLPAT